MLNPDNSNRYCEVAVRYGRDRFEDERLNELKSLAERVRQGQEAGEDPKKLARLETRLDKMVKDQFKRLSWDLCAFGDAPFFRFETPNNILTPANSSVWVKYSDNVEHSALIRVPQQVQAVCSHWNGRSNPRGS